MTKSRGILPARRYWTDAEVALLRDIYPECHTEDVAAWLDRTTKQCYAAAKAYCIAKSPEYLASPCAGRMSPERAQHPNMIASRFKKGQPAWNKGTKGVVGVQEGCRATQFKKGQMAGAAQRKYKPIGSLRISKDGYVERKTTDDPSIVPARRWVGVHRMVWEAAHGPIPDGHAVAFKPGRFTTDPEAITEDALELVTRAALMRRNSYHTNLPADVRRLVQLKGAITRQVNRIAREAQEQRA